VGPAQQFGAEDASGDAGRWGAGDNRGGAGLREGGNLAGETAGSDLGRSDVDDGLAERGYGQSENEQQ
jgi:hypothetical protein